MAATTRRAAAVQINPGWLDPADYIAFLNHSFPGQWDRSAYDWYIGRRFNGQSGAVLVRANACGLLSGMALSHRQVCVDGHAPMDVAVIGAAATLPSERGRGHYHAVLGAALQLARERRSVAVVAFAARENRSGRALLRLGARALPSFYVISRHARRGREASQLPAAVRAGGAPPPSVSGLERASPGGNIPALTNPRALSCRRTGPAARAQFHYARREDWRAQFIDRPNAVRAHSANDCVALIESVRCTDRLQWFCGPEGDLVGRVEALAAPSEQAQRDFFMYTLDAREAAAARRLGFEVRGGYVLLLPTGCSPSDWELLAGASWCIQSGDRL